jgi:hypothetical protein
VIWTRRAEATGTSHFGGHFRHSRGWQLTGRLQKAPACATVTSAPRGAAGVFGALARRSVSPPERVAGYYSTLSLSKLRAPPSPQIEVRLAHWQLANLTRNVQLPGPLARPVAVVSDPGRAAAHPRAGRDGVPEEADPHCASQGAPMARPRLLF